jgi:hypothetical protein
VFCEGGAGQRRLPLPGSFAYPAQLMLGLSKLTVTTPLGLVLR